MENYLNKNFNNAIKSFTVEQGVSKDSQTVYYYLILEFINGFQKRFYMNDAERFAIQNAFDVLDLSDNFNVDD